MCTYAGEGKMISLVLKKTPHFCCFSPGLVFHELTLIKITGFNAFPRTVECASSIRLSDFLLLIGAIRVGCLAVETEQIVVVLLEKLSVQNVC